MIKKPLTTVLLAVLSGLASTASAQTTASISGQVFYDRALSANELPPLIVVYDASGAFVKQTDGPISSGGSYTVSDLAPGTYYVRAKDDVVASAPFGPPDARSGRFGFVDQLFSRVTCVTDRCRVTDGTPVHVTLPQGATGIDFALQSGGAIAGVVKATPPIFVSSTTLFGEIEIFDPSGAKLLNRFLLPVPPVGPLGDEPNGRPYQLRGLPAGTYYLRSRVNGYADEVYDDIQCAECTPTIGKPVVVETNTTTSNVNFDLAPATAVSGTARQSSSSSALSGITITFVADSGRTVATVTTDGAGVYQALLAPGRYSAQTANTQGLVEQTLTGIVVPSSGSLSGVDFSLAPGIDVRGTVTSATGAPIAGALVTVVDSTGARAARPVSGAAGAWRATLLPGTYYARTDGAVAFQQELYRERACPGGACDPLTGDPIALSSSEVSGVDFTLASCAALTMTPRILAPALSGRAYEQRILASGGQPPYRYTVVDGALPPGLELDAASGRIAGTPLSRLAYAVTVAATDGTGCVQTHAYTLDVLDCTYRLQVNLSTIDTITFGQTHTAFVDTSSPPGLRSPCTWYPATPTPWIHLVNVDTPNGRFGFNVDPLPGATTRAGSITAGNAVLTVIQLGTGYTIPGAFGVIDTPAEGTVVSGAVAITGWALHQLGPVQVVLLRDSLPGEPSGQPFVGNAVSVRNARPDVEAAYATYPAASMAGWGYLMLTTGLPDGFVRVCAYSQGPGDQRLLGCRGFIVNNSSSALPFGSIDTPGQGQSISGSAYVNFGWALTPQPKAIPTDGSTIHAFVDGVDLGPVDYNHFRSDIANGFPGYTNAAGAVGFTVLDTTAMDEGTHTIGWSVTDDHGVSNGVGSRFFDVHNSPIAPSILSSVKVGLDFGRHPVSLLTVPAAQDGSRTFRIEPLEPLAIDFEQGRKPSDCAATYTGYQVVNTELRELPAGSTLDPAGAFSWQPGPGFVGTYELLFVRTACGGARERVPVRVAIATK